MDIYNRELLTHGALRFYMGKDYFRYIGDIKLLDRYSDVYTMNQLINMGFDLSKINKIGVGPQTVVLLYPEDSLNGTPTKYMNESNTEKTFDFPKVKSLMLYTLENYYRALNTRSCNTDSECNSNEYCICRDGKDDIRWCKKEGKICMPKGSYVQSDPYELNNNYVIDHNCVNKEFNTDTNYSALKTIISKCVSEIPGSQYLFKEGFSYNSNTNYFIFYVIMLILVIAYYKLK